MKSEAMATTVAGAEVSGPDQAKARKCYERHRLQNHRRTTDSWGLGRYGRKGHGNGEIRR